MPYQEERPPVDPAKMDADAKRTLDDAIRRESDASTSDQNRTGIGSAQNGPGGGNPGGQSGAGAGPTFDREAAKKVREATPIDRMANVDAAGVEKPIFSELELELLRLDLDGFRKKTVAERKKILEKFSAADHKDLVEKRGTLSNRKTAWIKRRVDDDERAFAEGRAKAQAGTYEAKRAAFLAAFRGHEPWLYLNVGIAKAIEAKHAGPWAAELATTQEEVAILAEPTRLVVEKHVDSVMALMGMVPCEVLLVGAVGLVFGPKLYDAWSRRRAAREAEKKKPPEERAKEAA